MHAVTPFDPSRVWLPAGLLLLAKGLHLQAPVLAGWVSLDASHARLLAQATATALWLAATCAGLSLLTAVLNTAAARRTGHRLPRLVTDLLAVVVWLAAGIGIASQVFEQPVGGLIATSSVALAVVGFAMRDTIASLIASIAINVERPYHLDDWISLPDGSAARIEEIGWFTTRAVTRDRVRVILPNSRLAAGIHENFGAAGWFWRDSVYLTLDAALPPARVKAVLEAALLDVEVLRLRPAGRRADVLLHETSLDGATWRLRYWLDDYAHAIELKDGVLRAALRHLHHAGLPLARPVREINEVTLPQPGRGDRRPLVEQLAKTELFASLDSAELETLARNAEERHLDTGATVIEAGAPDRSLFVIVEGLVDVLAAAAEGRMHRVSTLGPGSYFGEYALLCDEPRSATVRTLCKSRLFEIDREALAPMLEADPKLTQQLSEVLERRRSGMREALAARRGNGAEAPVPRHGKGDIVATIQKLFGLGDTARGRARARLSIGRSVAPGECGGDQRGERVALGRAVDPALRHAAPALADAEQRPRQAAREDRPAAIVATGQDVATHGRRKVGGREQSVQEARKRRGQPTVQRKMPGDDAWFHVTHRQSLRDQGVDRRRCRRTAGGDHRLKIAAVDGGLRHPPGHSAERHRLVVVVGHPHRRFDEATAAASWRSTRPRLSSVALVGRSI